MSKSEKRHFKVQAKTNPKNQKLVLLFDLIEKQDEYNEAKVKRSIKDPAFLKHFAVNKTRLYDFILKSLRSYYSTYNTRTQLLNQLTEIEVLYTKKLYPDCLKRINKAQKTAETHGMKWILYQLNDWEEKLLKEEGEYLQSSLQKLSKIKKENEDILKALIDSNSVKYHYFNLLLHSRNSVSRIESYRLSEIQNAIIRVNSGGLDHEGYINYLNLNALYNYYINRHHESLEQYQKVIEFIEGIPHGVIDFKRAHFTALNNVLITQSMCKMYQESTITLGKIHQLYRSSKEFEQEFFALTSCYELSIHAEVGNTASALPILESMKENIELYQLNDVNRYFFFFNAAKLEFFNEKYECALKWIEDILEDYQSDKKGNLNNLYYYSNLLFLLLHFELGNLLYLETQIPTVKRRLLQIRPLNDIDIKIMNLLEGLTLASSERHHELFLRTKKELDYLIQLPHKESIAHFFDIQQWINSKIEPQTFAQLVRQKHTMHEVV